MRQFDVSRTTLRRAVALLRGEGLIDSRQGHGTDITLNPQNRRGSATRMTEVSGVRFDFTCEAITSETSSEVIADVVSADEQTAKALELKTGEAVYRLRWLHYVNETPFLFLTNFVRMDMAPGLDGKTADMVSLYRLLLAEYGLIFSSATETIRPIVASFIEAQLLNVKAGAPLLLLCRAAACQKGPMEYAQSIIRPDMMRITMSITGINP
jgi:GntR family transcriptional regulator